MSGLSYDEKRVGVIFGFMLQILKLADEFKTNKFIFCWDSRHSYRKLIYPEYKAHRRVDMTEEETADLEDAYAQFDELRERFLPYLGFKNIFHQGGYEADDLIAYIVYRIPDDTMIVSADNDLFQLLKNDRFCPVRMWNFKVINTEEEFSKSWFGLKPIDWPNVKAISGCTSDNVVGVPGVGEITAAKYVAKILLGSKRGLIEDSKQLIQFNQRLVGLPFAGKKPIKPINLDEDEISPTKFKAGFGQYGFRSLLTAEAEAKWMKSFFGVK
jgi:DNA polymerase-1